MEVNKLDKASSKQRMREVMGHLQAFGVVVFIIA
jgi:hypothetical protein